MSKLWNKEDHDQLHPLVERYTVAEDYLLDRDLMPYDIEASLAHAQGLERIGILSSEELHNIEHVFEQLKKDWNEGKIQITVHDEDCHTVIESYLTSKIGEIGKKIHTGRSRNDQVLVALRLYMKDHLSNIHELTKKNSKSFLDFALSHKHIPMPGYTHTQQAMLSSLSHYMCSFVEALLDDCSILESTYLHVDKNPLGSAAAFGVSFPLDREYTTSKLGFSQIQVNSLYCQNSRGKFESQYMEALSQIMLTLGRFANDMLVFTSTEFNFFEISPNMTTGSSIMPQKRNVDVMEILRANSGVVLNNQHMIKDIAKNLLSGYNRDFQLLKKPLFESTKIVEESLKVVHLLVTSMKPKVDMIQKNISKEIFMADIANNMVKTEGIPFRDAYKKAVEQVDSYEVDMLKNLESKVSLGAPGNLGIEKYELRLESMKTLQI